MGQGTVGGDDRRVGMARHPILKAMAAVGSVVLFLGLGTASGYMGARYAVDHLPTTTTTMATTTTTGTTTTSAAAVTDPEGWDDLSNAEVVWCRRDRATWYQVLRAVETLGLRDFTMDLVLYRDAPWDTELELHDEMNRWAVAQGEEAQGRALAIACRAAFSGPDNG